MRARRPGAPAPTPGEGRRELGAGVRGRRAQGTRVGDAWSGAAGHSSRGHSEPGRAPGARVRALGAERSLAGVSVWMCACSLLCARVCKCVRVLMHAFLHVPSARVPVYSRVQECAGALVRAQEGRSGEGKPGFPGWEAGALGSPRESESIRLNFLTQRPLEHASSVSFLGREGGPWPLWRLAVCFV